MKMFSITFNCWLSIVTPNVSSNISAALLKSAHIITYYLIGL